VSAALNRHRRDREGLGLAALVSIGIGGMVGGIFSVLGLTVQIAGAGAYLSFVVGGVVAALTGWSYAVLSVRVRSRGGTAVFLDRAFGTGVAGPLNLLLWLSYFVMLGLYPVACGAYLVAPAAFPSAGAIVYAGALIFLGYEGFELIANAAEDARDPGRTLPRAYLIAIGGVIALYVLVAFVPARDQPVPAVGLAADATGLDMHLGAAVCRRSRAVTSGRGVGRVVAH
jgi:amino acid transporter